MDRGRAEDGTSLTRQVGARASVHRGAGACLAQDQPGLDPWHTLAPQGPPGAIPELRPGVSPEYSDPCTSKQFYKNKNQAKTLVETKYVSLAEKMRWSQAWEEGPRAVGSVGVAKTHLQHQQGPE